MFGCHFRFPFYSLGSQNDFGFFFLLLEKVRNLLGLTWPDTSKAKIETWININKWYIRHSNPVKDKYYGECNSTSQKQYRQAFLQRKDADIDKISHSHNYDKLKQTRYLIRDR